MREASGTSVESGLLVDADVDDFRRWMAADVHGAVFVVDMQESGPRGHDKLYSPNWFMFTAIHHIGRGVFIVPVNAQPRATDDYGAPLSGAISDR
jgi:hypothetical protein